MIICKLLILLVPSMTNSICGCADDKRLLQSLLSALSTAEEPEPMEKFTMKVESCCTSGMDLDIHPHNHYMLMTDVEVAEHQVSCEKKI